MHLQKLKNPIPKGAFVLIGVPDDRGVKIVGGRVGAKKGPDAIRKELRKMTVGELYDAGNLRLSSSQEKTYNDLSSIVEKILKRGAFPIVIGGGHDLSAGGLKGFLNVYRGGAVVNIDPHFDCRPREKDGRFSSGAAFRYLFETKKLKAGKLACFGFQAERNVREHLLYLKKRKANLIPRAEASPARFKKTLARLGKKSEAIALSFDMDCVEAASAPGVSALNVNGFSVSGVLSFIQTAAKNKKIKTLDLMEVNPLFDPDGRTARLAALLITHFLLARRK